MPHSVELLLDPDLEKVVTGAWDRLLDRGLPSQARHPHRTNRPHVTLAMAETFDGDARSELVDELTALPLPLRLDGLVVLGGRRRTVAWLVVPSAALLALHRAVHRVLRPPPSGTALLGPDRWVPHVTLAGRLLAEQVGEVVTGLGDLAVTAGTADRARSYDTVARTTTGLSSGRAPAVDED